MRVAILGADGLIGSAMQQALAFEEVYPYDRHTLDITNSKSLMTMVREVRPNFVVNCAGIADPEECESKPALAMLTNNHPLGYLSSVCNETGSQIIQFSPERVFAGQPGLCQYEYTEPNPVGVLGKSKFEAEKLLTRPGCDGRHFIIRSSAVFGQGRCFVNDVLAQAREGLEVALASDTYLSPTYAPDLARVVYRLMRERWLPGTYHTCNTGVLSPAMLAEQVLAFAGYDLKVKRLLSHQITRLVRTHLNGTLLTHKTEPLRPVSKALREYLVGIGELAPKSYSRFVEAR